MSISVRELMAKALEALPQAVLIADMAGRILARNAAAREHLPIGDRLPAANEHAEGALINWQVQLAALANGAEAVTLRSVNLPGEGTRRMLVDVHLRHLGPRPEGQTVLIVVEDVAERAAMERRLVASERLAALGQLAGRIAHELNNPLDGILRYIGLARRVAGEGARKYLDNARSGLQRMAEIIHDMLGQATGGAPGPDRTPIAKLLDEAIAVMQPPAHARGVSVVCDVAEDASVPMPGSLFQVFCNIIKNALDAMPAGGLLSIHMRPHSGHCVVELADTGCGIAEAEAERIFEPFYTTKPGDGAGLGLAVCRNILQRLGGSISAAPRPGGGTVITVRVPLGRRAGSDRPADAPAPEEHPPAQPDGSEE